jgi:hypothetical protein
MANFVSTSSRIFLMYTCTCTHLPLRPVLCCAVLCCAVLCCAVLCCAVLCCAVLCCAVLQLVVQTAYTVARTMFETAGLPAHLAEHVKVGGFGWLGYSRNTFADSTSLVSDGLCCLAPRRSAWHMVLPVPSSLTHGMRMSPAGLT